jgi:hypothetical protein
MINKGSLRVLLLLLLVALALSISVSCSMLLGPSNGKGVLKITSYAAPLKEEDLGDESNIKPIVQVEPAIGGKQLFVGDQAGLIHITDVPEGTYIIHPLHLPDSIDVSVDVVSGGVTTKKIKTPESGLVYCVINTDSQVQELKNSSLRTALAQAVDRGAVLNSFSSDKDAALNLLPEIFYHDGLEGLANVDESADENPGLDAPFSFELLYNDSAESTENQSVAAALEEQWGDLSFVSDVTLNPQDWSTYQSKLDDPSLETARAGWLLDSNNVLVFFQKLIDQANYENSTLTGLLDAAQGALDSGQIDEYTSTLILIHDHLIEHMVVIPLYYY